MISFIIAQGKIVNGLAFSNMIWYEYHEMKQQRNQKPFPKFVFPFSLDTKKRKGHWFRCENLRKCSKLKTIAAMHWISRLKRWKRNKECRMPNSVTILISVLWYFLLFFLSVNKKDKTKTIFHRKEGSYKQGNNNCPKWKFLFLCILCLLIV